MSNNNIRISCTPSDKEGNILECKDIYIAFLDILGFSKISKSKTEHDQNILRKYIEKLISDFSKISVNIATMPKGTERGPVIRLWFFSDTMIIALLSKHNNKIQKLENISHFLYFIRYIYDDIILSIRQPIRGSIVKGNVYILNPKKKDLIGFNPSMIYGKGIIDAYELSEEHISYPLISIKHDVSNEIRLADRKIKRGYKNFFVNRMSKELKEHKNKYSKLSYFIKTNLDGIKYLDILHPLVKRSMCERVVFKKRDYWYINDNNTRQYQSQIFKTIMIYLAIFNIISNANISIGDYVKKMKKTNLLLNNILNNIYKENDVEDICKQTITNFSYSFYHREKCNQMLEIFYELIENLNKVNFNINNNNDTNYILLRKYYWLLNYLYKNIKLFEDFTKKIRSTLFFDYF